jgi:hypothetical protein
MVVLGYTSETIVRALVASVFVRWHGGDGRGSSSFVLGLPTENRNAVLSKVMNQSRNKLQVPRSEGLGSESATERSDVGQGDEVFGIAQARLGPGIDSD